MVTVRNTKSQEWECDERTFTLPQFEKMLASGEIAVAWSDLTNHLIRPKLVKE
jgi:hypothetical protein